MMTETPTNTADLVTVPRKATEAMILAGAGADPRISAIWRAMVAAAPALAASPAHATGAMREEPQAIAADMKLIYAALQDYGLAIDDDSGSVDMTTLRAAYGACDRLQTAFAALSSPAPEGEAAQGVEPKPTYDEMARRCRLAVADRIGAEIVRDEALARAEAAEARLAALVPPSVMHEEAGRG